MSECNVHHNLFMQHQQLNFHSDVYCEGDKNGGWKKIFIIHAIQKITESTTEKNTKSLSRPKRQIPPNCMHVMYLYVCAYAYTVKSQFNDTSVDSLNRNPCWSAI